MSDMLTTDLQYTSRFNPPSFAQQLADRVYPTSQKLHREPQTPVRGTRILNNSEFIQSCTPIIEKHKPNTAPIAQMAPTPSKKPSNTDKGKGRAVDFAPVPVPSLGRESQTYQAQADEIEKARDRTDPDFATASTGRKRRRASTTHPTSPKKSKTSHQRNCLYDNLSPETRRARDKHISRIESNWNLPWEQWIPESMMPKEPGGSKNGIPQRPKKAQDWNNPLLEELVYLSKVTNDSHDKALQALRNAICRENRPKDGPLLYDTDVQSAVEECEKARRAGAEGCAAARSGSIAAPDFGTGVLDPQDVLLAAATNIDQDNGDPVNPGFSSRSPTIAHEAIKSEFGATDSKKRSAGGWNDWDDRREALRALEYQYKQHEAEAKANGIRYQIMLEEKALRDSRRRHGQDVENAIMVEVAGDGGA